MAGGSSKLELVITASATAAVAALDKVHNAVDALNRKTELTKRAGDFLGSAFKGVAIGAGIAAFTKIEEIFSRLTDAIPSLIEKGVAFGEQVNLVGQLTGATAEQASTLLGVFQILGVSTDNVGAQFVKVARTLQSGKVDLSAFDAETRKTILTTDNLVVAVDAFRHGMSQLENGAAKTRIQFQAFGRNAAELTEYFAQNDDQMALLEQTVRDLGIVIDEQGVAKAEGLGKTMKLLGVAVQGLANRLLNDVAPVVASFVERIAKWIGQHSEDIARFVGNALNWIIGFINALTGANMPLVSFGSLLESLGSKGDRAADGIDSTTDAMKAQTAAINAQIKTLQEKDRADELVYTREKRYLDSVLQAQLDALDAADRARQAKASEAQLAQDLIDAQERLAQAKEGGDPAQVAAAADRVRDIYARMAEAQVKSQEDARRAQIDTIKQYLSDLDRFVSEEVDKKKLADGLAAREKALQSGIAAAKEKGDAQSVADLSVELEAVKAAEKRTKTKSASDVAIAALEAERAAIKGTNRDVNDLTSSFDWLKLKTPEVAAAMKQAFADGSKAAEDFKKTLAGIADIFVGKDGKGGIVGAVGTLASALASINLPSGAMKAIGLAIAGFGAARLSPWLVATGLAIAGYSEGGQDSGGQASSEFGNMASAAALGAGVGSKLGPLGAGAGAMGAMIGAGIVDQFTTPISDGTGGTSTGSTSYEQLLAKYNSYVAAHGSGALTWSAWVDAGMPTRAMGGPVAAYGTYLVGEQGPELLTMGGQGGYVSPNAGSASSVVVHTHVNLDGQRVADLVDRHLFNGSRLWQGIVGGSSY